MAKSKYDGLLGDVTVLVAGFRGATLDETFEPIITIDGRTLHVTMRAQDELHRYRFTFLDVAAHRSTTTEQIEDFDPFLVDGFVPRNLVERARSSWLASFPRDTRETPLVHYAFVTNSHLVEIAAPFVRCEVAPLGTERWLSVVPQDGVKGLLTDLRAGLRGRTLVEYWRGRLGRGEFAVLEALAKSDEQTQTRIERNVDEGYRVALAKLAALGLVEADQHRARAVAAAHAA